MAQDTNKPGKQPVRLGKYEILKRIATGGMGTVYRGIDTELQRLVAIKILSPELARNPRMLERFRREARSAARLRHENIVAIYDYGEESGAFYLALEFVDGKDLHDFVRGKGRLDPDEARDILIQATRALEHAHAQGIVHRDIKPSNFLVSQVGGRLQVKLTDMGLARIKGDEDTQLTKDHSTVGTLDYMAPEQAQNSRAADIRSDIYSLGCTFYHMLAGHAPFPKGSVPEKIIAHLKLDPPDIRTINEKVDPDLAAILKKMTAKKREDRYQNPSELLADLLSTNIGLQPLEDAEAPNASRGESSEDVPAKPPSRSTAAPAPARHGLEDRDEQKPKPATRSVKRYRGEEPEHEEAEEPAETTAGRPWPLYLLLAAGVTAAAAVLWYATRPEGTPGVPSPTPGPIVRKGPEKDKEEIEPPPVKKASGEMVGPPRPVYPALHKPALPLDALKLRQNFLEGRKTPAVLPADAPVIVWRRGAGDGPNEARTLSEALAKIKDGPAIIEIRDNGPLWISRLPVQKGKTIHLRAGSGYRPLLAWDLALEAKDAARRDALSCADGSLSLEGIDFVAHWPDGLAAAEAAFFDLRHSSFAARDCTFSLAGKPPTAVRLVRSSSSGDASVELERCFVRGAAFQPFDLTGPTDVLLEESLIVAGADPVVQAKNRGGERTSLRLLRTTLTSSQNALKWIVDKEDEMPSLSVFAWDALLARNDLATPQGDLFLLTDAARASAVRWRSLSCVFAGWKRLLVAPDAAVASGSLEAWRRRWSQAEGDMELNEPWPPRAVGELAEASESLFRATSTPACFARSVGQGMLGCDIASLPPAPAGWLTRTYERSPRSLPPLTDDAAPPPIPTTADGLYHGEKLDLTKIDLGRHLANELKSRKPGPRIVLHLAGRGKCVTSPIRVSGVSEVVLYHDAAASKDDPLIVTVKPGSVDKEEALLEVEDGTLVLQGMRLMFPDSRTAIVPPHLVLVRDGALKLKGCVFQGPYALAPDGYRALVRCAHNRLDAETPAILVIQDCVLRGHRRLLEFHGGNAVLRARNNVLQAGEDAIHLAPAAERHPRLTLLLENNTAAVRRCFLTVVPDAEAEAPLEPIVVDAARNYFLDPFVEEPRQAALLCLTPRALSQGWLLWQGTDNALEESRWSSLWSAGAGEASCALASGGWRSWWGPREGAFTIVTPAATSKNMPSDSTQYHRLVPPPPYRLGVGAPPFGADLLRLDLVRKKG